MQNTEPTVPQWLCECCWFALNGGEPCQCCNAEDLLKLFGDMEITAGMLREEHAEDCDPESECDCETKSFSWSRCDGCGENSGGTRNAVTGWVPATA